MAIGRSGASPHSDAPPFRLLSRKYEIEGLAEALAEGIFVGHPDMPEFVFEAEEVGAILRLSQIDPRALSWAFSTRHFTAVFV